MRTNKWNKQAQRLVFRFLDKAVKRFGIKDVRHATSKWSNGQRDRARLLKQSNALKRELAQVRARLR